MSSPSQHRFRTELDRVEAGLVGWLVDHSIEFLRGGLGIVFLWFGALKFVPGLSPAQGLAVQTIHVLTLGLLPSEVGLVLLAMLECTIGIGFLTGRFMRATLVLMGFQMLGTLTPLVLFPGTAFTGGSYALTLEGQYIIKNLVLIGGGMVIGATVRGGRLSTPAENSVANSRLHESRFDGENIQVVDTNAETTRNADWVWGGDAE